jgi:hypothetical protein
MMYEKEFQMVYDTLEKTTNLPEDQKKVLRDVMAYSWRMAIEAVREDLKKKLSDILKCEGDRFTYEATVIREFLDNMK